MIKSFLFQNFPHKNVYFRRNLEKKGNFGRKKELSTKKRPEGRCCFHRGMLINLLTRQCTNDKGGVSCYAFEGSFGLRSQGESCTACSRGVVNVPMDNCDLHERGSITASKRSNLSNPARKCGV